MSVRVTIGVAYVAFVVFSIWVSLTQLNLGLKLAKLVPYDSATFRYLTALETFRYSPTSAEVVIPGRLDYFSDLEVRTKLLQFVRSLEYSDFSLNAEFWLRDCLLFLQSSAAVVNPTNFPRFVQEVFLQLPKFKHYQSAVNMATDSDGNLYISGSRFHLHLVNSGGENRSRAMEFLRKRIDQDAPVPMWIFEVSFPLSEQNDLIAVDVLQNLGIGGLCVLLISGLFSPQLLSTISIGFAVISMNIGVIAGFALWDIQLDIFALICILLSLATSVSPVVHLASQFVTVTVTEVPWMKTQSALFTVGWPILQTCLLCILAAIPLVATGSYLGFILVKTVLLVAILGLFHSLLVLPVLLITADEFLQFVLGKKQRQADTDE